MNNTRSRQITKRKSIWTTTHILMMMRGDIEDISWILIELSTADDLSSTQLIPRLLICTYLSSFRAGFLVLLLPSSSFAIVPLYLLSCNLATDPLNKVIFAMLSNSVDLNNFSSRSLLLLGLVHTLLRILYIIYLAFVFHKYSFWTFLALPTFISDAATNSLTFNQFA